ncbi:MAG: sodium:calcium symporter, partial [Thermodesulfobacteriota bacterium]
GLFFILSVPLPVFVKGALDEMDFWVATFALVFLALFEVILFFWVFGADNAWAEITRGARIRVPRVFYYLMKYVTPFFLIVILVVWGFQELPKVLGKGGEGVWAARAFLAGLLALHIIAVRKAWKRRRSRA